MVGIKYLLVLQGYQCMGLSGIRMSTHEQFLGLEMFLTGTRSPL